MNALLLQPGECESKGDAVVTCQWPGTDIAWDLPGTAEALGTAGCHCQIVAHSAV